MPKALLYRANGKGPIAVAFLLTIGLHITAVALATSRQPILEVKPPSTEVIGFEDTIEPPPPPPTIQPEEFSLSDTPPPPPDVEFIEPKDVERRVEGHRPPKPVPNIQRGTAANAAMAKTAALNAPRPEYPYAARSRRITGSGVCTIAVDFVTGFVTDAQMTQTTGSPLLDNATLSTMKRWRFKPGTIRKVRIPIEYRLEGVSF
jgi:TonB family protein